MPSKFVLTAELQLQGPVGMGGVISKIQRGIGKINANINVRVNPATVGNLNNLTKNVKDLDAALKTMRVSANAAARALTLLGRAASTSNAALAASAKSLSSIVASLNKVNKASAAATDSVEDFGAKSALALKRFAAFSVATSGILGFAFAAKNAFKEALEFERELVKVSQVTGKTLKSLGGLTSEISRLSTTFGVSSKSLVNVSQVLAQAGLTARDTRVALEALAKTELSPTFEDISQTTEGAIAIMRQFGVEAGGLESTLSSLNAVAGQFAVESSDIIAAVRRAGGAFKSAGGSFNEFIALFTSVRQTTRESAESIATGFRTIFTRIQRPATISFLKDIGVQLTDLNNKFIGPFQAVGKLSEALAQLDPRDIRFAQVIEELGGFRQVSKVIPLIQQYSVAQKALGVAQRGTTTLADDAVSAQQSLLVQLSKVREEFLKLFRTVANNSAIRSFVEVLVSLSTALNQLGDSLAPVLPALIALGSIKIGGVAASFAKGFFGKKAQGGRVERFARGGIVPGSGNGDTVPAMLEPGEFVIRKKAVQAIGAEKLFAANKKAVGGLTVDSFKGKNKKEIFEILKAEGAIGSDTILQKTAKTIASGTLDTPLLKKLLSRVDEASLVKEAKKKNRLEKAEANFPKFGAISLEPIAQNNDSIKEIIVGKSGNNVPIKRKFRLIAASLPGSGKKDIENSVSNELPNTLNTLAQKIGGELLIPPNDIKKNNFVAGKDSVIGHMFESVIARLGAPFDENVDDKRRFDFPQGIGKDLAAKFGKPELANIKVEAKKNYQKSIASIRDKVRLEFKDQRKAKFADGGSVSDTVPSLLTPGEFVVNKKAASSIGLSTLNKLNKADKIKGFARGGPVGFAPGGTVTAGQAGLGLLFVLPQITSQMGELGDVIEKLVGVVIAATSAFALSGVDKNDVLANIKGLFAKQAAGPNLTGGAGTGVNRRAILGNLSTSLGAPVGIGLAVGGGFVSSAANNRISQGQDATGLAALGGGISGAGTGLAIGAMFGPVGAAVGLLGGAAVGAANSFADAQKQLDSINFEKSFTKFTSALEKVGAGRATASSQLSTVIAGINEAETRQFSDIGEEERKSVKAQLQQQATALEAFTAKMLASAKSVEDIDRIFAGSGRSVLEFQSRLLDIPLDEFKKQLENSIKSRGVVDNLNKLANDAANALNIQVRFARDFTAAINDAVSATVNLTDLFDSISQGGLAQTNFKGFGDIFNRAGKGGVLSSDSLATASSNVFGGFGGSDISTKIVQINDAIRQLPDALTRVAAAPRTQDLDFLEAQLEKEFAELPDFIREQFLGKAGRIAEGEKGELSFIKRVQDDLLGVVSDLSAGFEEIISAADNAGKQLGDAFNGLIKGLSSRNQALVKVQELQINGIKIRIEEEKALASALDRDVDYNKIAKALDEQQRVLAGPEFANIANSPKALGDALAKTREELVAANTKIQNAAFGADAPEKASKEFADLSLKANKLERALEALANSSDKLNLVQEQLSKEQSRKSVKGGLASDVLFGTLEEQNEIARNVARAGAASQQGNLAGFSGTSRKGALSIFDQFADVTSDLFGGKTGRQAKADIIVGEAQRQNLPKELVDIIQGLFSQTPEEQKLLGDIKTILNDSKKANDELIKAQTDTANKLEAATTNGFRDTIAAIKAGFASTNKQRLDRELVSAQGEAAKIDAGLKARDQLIGQTGVQEEDIRTIGLNLDKIREVAKDLATVAKLPTGILSSDKLLTNTDRFNFGVDKSAQSLPQTLADLTRASRDDDTRAGRSKLTQNLRGLNLPGFGGITSDINSIDAKEVRQFLTNPEFIKRSKELGVDTTQDFKDLTAGSRANFIKELNDVFAKSINTKITQTNTSKADLLAGFDGASRTLVESMLANTQAITDFDVKFKQIPPDTDKATKSLEELRAKIVELGNAANLQGGAVAKADGGPIFSPRGTDTVPAMLTPGEFVINAKAAKQNRALLESINGGTKYAANGGLISYFAHGGISRATQAARGAAQRKKIQDDILKRRRKTDPNFQLPVASTGFGGVSKRLPIRSGSDAQAQRGTIQRGLTGKDETQYDFERLRSLREDANAENNDFRRRTGRKEISLAPAYRIGGERDKTRALAERTQLDGKSGNRNAPGNRETVYYLNRRKKEQTRELSGEEKLPSELIGGGFFNVPPEKVENDPLKPIDLRKQKEAESQFGDRPAQTDNPAILAGQRVALGRAQISKKSRGITTIGPSTGPRKPVEGFTNGISSAVGRAFDSSSIGSLVNAGRNALESSGAIEAGRELVGNIGDVLGQAVPTEQIAIDFATQKRAQGLARARLQELKKGELKRIKGETNEQFKARFDSKYNDLLAEETEKEYDRRERVAQEVRDGALTIPQKDGTFRAPKSFADAEAFRRSEEEKARRIKKIGQPAYDAEKAESERRIQGAQVRNEASFKDDAAEEAKRRGLDYSPDAQTNIDAAKRRVHAGDKTQPEVDAIVKAARESYARYQAGETQKRGGYYRSDEQNTPVVPVAPARQPVVVPPVAKPTQPVARPAQTPIAPQPKPAVRPVGRAPSAFGPGTNIPRATPGFSPVRQPSVFDPPSPIKTPDGFDKPQTGRYVPPAYIPKSPQEAKELEDIRKRRQADQAKDNRTTIEKDAAAGNRGVDPYPYRKFERPDSYFQPTIYPERRKFRRDGYYAPGYNEGGLVDSVPAMLTPGEFVINKNAANRVGHKALQRLNKGGPVGFQNGGKVPTGGTGGGANMGYVCLDDKSIKTMNQFNAMLKSNIGDLEKVAKLFPTTISVEHNIQQNINVNGGELLSNLKGELTKIFQSAVQGYVIQVIKEHFPGSGPISETPITNKKGS